jgi:hypothetical protein
MYSFVPPFREATFCGVPSCVFDKLGCAAGKKKLRNTAIVERYYRIRKWRNLQIWGTPSKTISLYQKHDPQLFPNFDPILISKI